MLQPIERRCIDTGSNLSQALICGQRINRRRSTIDILCSSAVEYGGGHGSVAMSHHDWKSFSAAQKEMPDHPLFVRVVLMVALPVLLLVAGIALFAII